MPAYRVGSAGTDAGYGPNKRLKVKTITSASGSGQMQPVPMNEFVQQALRACYFDVELEVIEWNALFTNWREGAKDPKSRGAHATNVTFAAMDPFFAMVRFTSSKTQPPVSNNWGYFINPEFDDLIAKARNTFDDKGRVELRLTPAGARVQHTRSNALGRFAFNQLRVGDYRLRASTERLGEVVRDIHVPSPSGEYDVMF